ncbi:MAG: bifunctional glycosyltransferase family 2/GtrA family protein [Clostridiales bacterium]|nr:bifunctional glycosyltransferase family 2/GtrA family protein [Clostridiales bacterium]
MYMTENNMRIALIPAYEPTEIMLSVLEIANDEGFSVVVVDDGSGDVFSEIFKEAEKFGAVLHHRENMGKGCALKTGFKYIEENFEAPYTVVTMDADGQHSVLDALSLCSAAEAEQDALILGSRGLEQNVPLRSRIGNSVTRLVFKAKTGIGIHDTQTGLRAFSHRLLPFMLEISGERYEYEMNVLLAFAERGCVIREVPVLTIYFENNSESHFKTVSDSYRIYKEIFGFSAASLTCFFIDYFMFGLFSALLSGFGSLGLTISNISARIISGSVNFTMNRSLVFKSRGSLLGSGVKYFVLAAFILAGNTLVLNLLVYNLGINRFLAKPMTEIFFFLVSWLAQRHLVFNAKGGKQTV